MPEFCCTGAFLAKFYFQIGNVPLTVKMTKSMRLDRSSMTCFTHECSGRDILRWGLMHGDYPESWSGVEPHNLTLGLM